MQIPGALIPLGEIQMLAGIPLTVVLKLGLKRVLDRALEALLRARALRVLRLVLRAEQLLEGRALLGLEIPTVQGTGLEMVMGMEAEVATEKVEEVVPQAVVGLAAITPLTL
jgi:hypothetical protein